jgi:FkbM family methyltransferase
LNEITNNLPRCVILESIYGKFIVNRYDQYCGSYLLSTGKTQLEDELENIFSIVDNFSNNCVIIDGGANFGFFSLPVSNRIKHKNGIILAFEPQYDIFNALAGTIVLNNIDNVIANRIGLAEVYKTGIVPVVDYSVKQDFGMIQLDSIPNSSMMEMLFKNYTTITSKERVELIAIDSLNLSRLDLLKLDIEGYEPFALEGARNTIINNRPYIWVEYFISGQDPIEEELKYLENYDVKVMDPLNMLFSPKEKILVNDNNR